MAVSLGFASDAIVQEFYVDDDVDQAVREAIEGETGHPLVDVDYADVVDGAIVWWRADDAEEEDSRTCSWTRCRTWTMVGLFGC